MTSMPALALSTRGVVVTPVGLPTVEAKTFATQRDKLLLSDYLEGSRPGEEPSAMLRSKLERGQRAWLAGDIENARTEFRSVTELALKADWKTSQREALQGAYFRLAQISESKTERQSWLETAARLFQDLSPDSELFPPPVLSEYDSIKNKLAAVVTDVELTDVFPDFRYVLIDGRKYDLAVEQTAHLNAGVHRVTGLSDSREAVTEFVTPTQMRMLRLSPPLLVEGSCDSAKFRSRAVVPSSLQVEVYTSASCVPLAENILKSSRISSREVFEMPKEDPATLRKSDHTWIWVVGAALVAGAGYAIASHHDSTPETVHRSGF